MRTSQTIDKSAELIALTMLLSNHTKCECGFLAEGSIDLYNPFCGKCGPAYKEKMELAYQISAKEHNARLRLGPVTEESKATFLRQGGPGSNRRHVKPCGCLAIGNQTIQFCADDLACLSLQSEERRDLKLELYPNHKVVARFNALLRGEE